MAQDLKTEAEAFIRSYAALFASPECSSLDHVAKVADKVGRHYRPDVTFFTNGGISRFESQEEAARLIEKEMRKAISYGIGVHLALLHVQKVEIYSQTSALCWIEWKFIPQAGSEYEGKGWTFTNIYGYRAATDSVAAGWEFVVRDQEVNEMVKVIGKSFDA